MHYTVFSGVRPTAVTRDFWVRILKFTDNTEPTFQELFHQYLQFLHIVVSFIWTYGLQTL